MSYNSTVFLSLIIISLCVMALSLTEGHAILRGTFFKKERACQESSFREPPCKEKLYNEFSPKDKLLNNSSSKDISFEEKDLIKLKEESAQKVEELLKDKDFQSSLAGLKNKTPNPLNTQFPSQNSGHGNLYIFVSFSMGEKALEHLAYEAKQYGATLVLKGFVKRSYKKTVQALQKIIQNTEQGFLIDPELFELFDITAVPTYVLAKPFSLAATERLQTPLHDRLQGHVSIQYVLEEFAKEGALAQEAKFLPKKGGKE